MTLVAVRKRRVRPVGDRIGTFRVSLELIAADPQTVRAVIAKCIIVACVHDPVSHEYRYTALSHMFDEKRRS